MFCSHEWNCRSKLGKPGGNGLHQLAVLKLCLRGHPEVVPVQPLEVGRVANQYAVRFGQVILQAAAFPYLRRASM